MVGRLIFDIVVLSTDINSASNIVNGVYCLRCTDLRCGSVGRSTEYGMAYYLHIEGVHCGRWLTRAEA